MIDDALLGQVEVLGFTDGRLSWPRVRQKGPAAPVLTDELEQAVRRESEIAVAWWWGVSIGLVQRWRRALGVEAHTEGTRRLLRDNNLTMPPHQRSKANAAIAKPEARAKAANTRRGKPAHPNTVEALHRGRLQPKSPEWGQQANAWMLAGKAKIG